MAQGGNKGDDGDVTMVMLVGLFFVLGWFVWSAAKQPIVEAIRWAKISEASVFQIFQPDLAKDREMLGTLRNDQIAAKKLREQAKAAKVELGPNDYAKRGLLSPSVLWGASNRIGAVMRWPVAAFCFGWAIFYMFYSKKTKFRTRYDLEGLIRVQAKVWPVIAPIVNFNPTENNSRNPGEPVPAQLPLFAEALSPEEWISYNQVALVQGQDKDTMVPDRDALRRAFQLQLGPRWTGLQCLTEAQRCLFAGFALKGMQKRRESDTLMGKISLAWTDKGGFNPSAELMAEVNKVLHDDAIGGHGLKIADAHAFRTTAMIGMLKWARERGGVLAPGTFIWLRGHDRNLWYPLNNLGRRSYHSEAAGAMAHFMAEKAATRPLPIPRLETAILTVIQYWAKYSPKVPGIQDKRKA